MAPKNAFYAQSGGVTAVINASACGVLQTARQNPQEIGKVYAGRNGIIGALTEDLIDTSLESEAAIAALKHTPGAAFGSCRYKLASIEQQRAQYERLIEVFEAHDIGFFFYNGGGDFARHGPQGQPDGRGNWLPDCVRGYSQDNRQRPADHRLLSGFRLRSKIRRHIIREAAFDLASISRTSTKVFAMEVMGRHAGWMTAACALAAQREGDAPHILLLPEIAFDEARFLAKVERALSNTATA